MNGSNANAAAQRNGTRPPRFDRDAVKAAARGRWPDILAALAGIPPDLLDGRPHPCPKCGGNDRFRLVDADAGAVRCNQCFSERCGDGLAAVGWMTGKNFPEALSAVADHLGVAPSPAASGTARPAFVPHTAGVIDAVVDRWCNAKSPVTADAAKAAGVVTGTVGKAWDRGRVVIAFPARKSPDAAPHAHLLLPADGGTFPAWSYKNCSLAERKSHCVGNDGWVFTCSPAEWAAADTVVRVEGVADALALAPHLPDGTVAVSNIAGAGSGRVPLEPFAGKRVVAVGDADEPGVKGAKKFAARVSAVAADVRLAALPFDVTADHGKDVRDLLAAADDPAAAVADLLAGAEPFVPPVTADGGERDGTGGEDASGESGKLDPGELDAMKSARSFLALRCTASETDPLTGDVREHPRLRSHRGAWHWHDRTRYIELNADEVRARIWRHLDGTFSKLTRGAVGNVAEATASLSIVPSRVEPPAMLGGEPAPPRGFVAFRNGLLDVSRLLVGDDEAIRPHTAAWFSPTCLPYDHDPSADCPTWRRVIERNLSGDRERIDLWQEWTGYCLIPNTDRQKFLLAVGEGANGKSVALAALHAVLGTANVSAVPLERFGERFSLHATLGKLANIAAEVGELDRVAEGHLKQFTSGDPLEFERKYRDPLTAEPTARCVFSTNNLPRFADGSGGLWRRMILLPFNETIPEAERVRGMDKPKWWEASGELPGLFNWAVEGLRRLEERGEFTRPAVCDAALAEYRVASNPARTFLLDHYRAEPHGRAEKAAVYAAYKAWAVEGGYRPLSESNFAKEVLRTFPAATTERPRVAGRRVQVFAGVAEGADDDGHDEPEVSDAF